MFYHESYSGMYVPFKEKVLPKQSLLYESYCVLNEINNLRIHGKRIVPELKQDIYREVFQGLQTGKESYEKEYLRIFDKQRTDYGRI